MLEKILKKINHDHLWQVVYQKNNSILRVLPALIFASVFIFLPTGSTLLGSTQSEIVPTIEIVGVKADESVTIKTHDLPASTEFTVTMGLMGTRAVDGHVVGTLNSESGSSIEATFNIPAELAGSYQISIRLQSPGMFPYYAYNWFFNNTTNGSQTPTPTPPIELPIYSGIPTFKIMGVERDNSVAIETADFPPNQTFVVTMGPMGTQGSDGIEVGTLDSGSGGKLTATYSIPSELQGMERISIRTQTTGENPFYAYNWFWNYDADITSN